MLALITIPSWACATAIDSPTPDSLLSRSDSAGNSSAGSDANAGRSDVTDAGSGALGAGGSPSNTGGGKGGASAGGMGNSPGSTAGSGGTSSVGSSGGGTGHGGSGTSGGGTSSGAGKGGTSSGGTTMGGMSSGAGTGGTSSGGTSSGGTSSGGTSSSTCDAAHAVATLMTSQVYTGKANDCVRLAVNPTWSTIALQFQPQPGTQGYPVPFSFFSCGGNGTGSLTADYMNTTFKSGTNPGCDFFVQFGGGETTIKVTYYD